ncbi:MAG: GNAT family N-acetyltransferase [Pseudomonadota bacterium]
MTTTSADIRVARPDDAAAITTIHDLAWRNAYRGIIPGITLERMIARRGESWWNFNIRRGGAVLVLEVCGTVAGYISVGRARARTAGLDGEVYELYLHPHYQGLGFGKKLLSAGFALLRRNNLNRIGIRVLADNDAAVAFYRACGGRVVAHQPEKVGDKTLYVSVYGFDQLEDRAA